MCAEISIAEVEKYDLFDGMHVCDVCVCAIPYARPLEFITKREKNFEANLKCRHWAAERALALQVKIS